MPVSILQPPEAIWGYDLVTSAYNEDPKVSGERIIEHAVRNFPGNPDIDYVRLIGKI
jgi:outer membrane protein assembly factor BamD (BamD/ComL family)